MYVGLTMVFALAALATLPWRVLSDALAVLGGVCLLAAILAVPGMIKAKRESKYDLGALLKVHEREELRQIELEEPLEYDSVHCMGCGETYNARLGVCPKCKTAQGHRN
jgi:hypothetical protein